MGLFDDLKKTALGKIVDTVQKTIENTPGASIKPSGGHENYSRPAAPQSRDTGAGHASTAANVPAGNIDQKFDEILAAEFSDLKVVKNASPESIGISAPHPCRPYSYALLRNGKTVAAIMLTPHNRDKNSAFLNAKKSALNSNITFLNFYTHFTNERNYVISRIKKAL